MEKYSPTTQKALFSNNVVSHIRKWIAGILYAIENKKDVRKVLLVYGPSGCGKTATMKVLLKSFNIIKIDSSEIKGTKNIDDIISGTLRDANSPTLANELKSSLHTKKKPNIVFIDGIDSADINYNDFISRCFKHYNIAFVLTATTQKLSSCNIGHDNTKYIELTHPSKLEMVKLGTEINKKENLNLSIENLERIVDLSGSDVRQFFYILDQWKLCPINIEKFLNNVQTANHDIDFSTKMKRLTSCLEPYNFTSTYELSISDTALISNQLFQNYCSTPFQNDINEISDAFSLSNIIHSKVFDEQIWQLYEYYISSSCVTPSFLLKSKNISITNLVPFKDVSSNFSNSLREVRDICSKNFQNKRLDNSTIWGHTLHRTTTDKNVGFMLSKIVLHHCKIVLEYYNKNKKGQNTSKKEKIELCDLINNDPHAEKSLKYIVDTVLEYRLFELDINKMLSKNSVISIYDNVEQVDLRTFKRFLNIHTIGNNAIIKSNVEMAIKYKILQNLIHHLEETKVNLTNNIDNLVVDLCDIWAV